MCGWKREREKGQKQQGVSAKEVSYAAELVCPRDLMASVVRPLVLPLFLVDKCMAQTIMPPQGTGAYSPAFFGGITTVGSLSNSRESTTKGLDLKT